MYCVTKRGFDIIASVILLIILSPIIILFSTLIRVKLGSPVFFTQARIGKKNKVFTLLKFRSMTDEKDDEGNILPDKKRLTYFGKWLRSSSIDELPSLINVMKGEMSLVGPRPLLVEYLPLYTQEQARRHEVRPGLTGWAQINGRNAITWEEKFKLDIWYVDHRSFFLDLTIICRTLGKVFSQEGISADNYSTMPKFTGKDED